MDGLARGRQAALALAAGVALVVASSAAAQPTTSVTVAGNVAESKAFTVDDLKRLPAHEIEVAPRREADTGSGSPARRYTGCLLRDVLNAARPTESRPREFRRSYVVATASDGYEVVFSWGELFLPPPGERVYVVYARDGAPLGDDEGRIALVALSDRRSTRHVKWLRSLTLRAA